MNKLSTTSTPKIPTQLPQKSAWARGPPQTSTAVTSTSASPTRSQSPALPPQQNATNPPVQTHSRRSSTFGHGQKAVTIKDGINIPSRGHVGSSKQSTACFIRDDPMLQWPGAAGPRTPNRPYRAWDTRPFTSSFLWVADSLPLFRFRDFWVNRRQFRDNIFFSSQCALHKD